MVTQVVEWRDRCHAVAKDVQAYIRNGATDLQRYRRTLRFIPSLFAADVVVELARNDSKYQ